MITDTTTPAAEAQLRALRAMTPQRRLALAVGWSRSVREMSRAGIKRQFPAHSESQVQRMLAGRLLGEELATQVYGPLITHG
ncbi:MAG: hypothetical protein KDK97_07225 [Verrucomicrobiales bacterium]|nr:hypothetical protein [Verrucomicrobiales bacterium]MCP5556139.1 hypothetical protein [Verrucomicrobiaceae bacterium]